MRRDAGRQPLVLVAGQVPPPVLGQYVATKDLVARLGRSDRFRTGHLAFRFARSAADLRAPRIGKVLEVVRVIGRVSLIRLQGPIDCLIYPVGGPSPVVALRDTVLLPPLMLLSRHTVLLFHSGGHREAWAPGRLWQRMAAWVYRRADAAIALTDYGRRDPEFVGIGRVFVAPHQPADTRDNAAISRPAQAPRLLYLGSIDAQKGVPELLDAVSRLDGDFELYLVGETHPSYPEERLAADIDRLGIGSRVVRTGVLTGREKAEVLGSSELLVFPSFHPGETFGLVLVEALMWELPVVAVDWRGARDVLGPMSPELLVDPSPPLAASLERALRFALQHRARWPEWGAANRARYEQRFRPGSSTELEDAIAAVLDGARI